MNSFAKEINIFEESLNAFSIQNNIPVEEWFAHPDHLAVVCADANDFDKIIETCKPNILGNLICGTNIDGCTVAVARLIKPIPLISLGEVEWLEIIKKNPENNDSDVVGLEHIEFYYPHFERVINVLHKAGIDYKEQQGSIAVPFNEEGQLFKLNDNTLSNITNEELEKGTHYNL